MSVPDKTNLSFQVKTPLAGKEIELYLAKFIWLEPDAETSILKPKVSALPACSAATIVRTVYI